MQVRKENINHNQKKNQSTETDPAMMLAVELIKYIAYVRGKKKSMNIVRRETEDIKMTQTKKKKKKMTQTELRLKIITSEINKILKKKFFFCPLRFFFDKISGTMRLESLTCSIYFCFTRLSVFNFVGFYCYVFMSDDFFCNIK